MSAKARIFEAIAAQNKLMAAALMEDDAKPVVSMNSTEKKIFNCIGNQRVLGKTIAKALDRQEPNGNPDSDLRSLLGTLVRHGFLTNEKGQEGYCVHPFWMHLVEGEDGE